jgi:hypothetical protein
MKGFSFFISSIFFSLIFILSGCEKPGSGGDVKLSFWVKHHRDAIPGAIVYLKYGAKDFPGHDISKYDDYLVTGTEGHDKGHGHFQNLKRGHYYLYSTGFDSAINMEVSGGIPVDITNKAGELMLDVPVSEGHQ